ncbi:MAG: RNA polymerase factor sigma-54 [Clostridiales Family XIII bacterium]|jgi:RNA polymerase sigma-54 factor|nr:RNA polymerase factor sigma-54 [Clostridiales Family XIII bacterium]
MRLEIDLKIAQKQTLSLTPSLLQAIRVLGMTRAELDAYLEEATEANPVLDAEAAEEKRDDEAPAKEDGGKAKETDFDWAEYLNDKNYDDVSYAYTMRSFAGSYTAEEAPEAADERAQTLRDYLVEQLSTADLSKALPDVVLAGEIAFYILESLDDNGFLTQTPEEMAKALGVKPEEVGRVLMILRTFDPPGVCAENLADCLILQVQRRGVKNPQIRKIIRECLPDVAAGRISAIARKTGAKRADAEAAVALVRTLDPKPGRGFAGSEKTQYIIPDIFVEKAEAGDGYEVLINHAGIPGLTVSPYYRKVLAGARKGSEEYRFLTERLNAAVMLIKSLEQREQTIYNVTNAVLQRQSAFLEKGREYLRPLTLKQVATELGIHESTVSRTIRGKYIQTPRGVFELKYFFASGVQAADGSDFSSESVRQRISELVAQEDAANPLSDERLTQILQKEGKPVSRRTVAKYRDESGIPSSQARRIRRP